MERCKFHLGKLKNYRFFDIFLDILHKMKENLDQEHVRRGLLSFQGDNWNDFPLYHWKNDSFSSFHPFSTHPSLKSGFPT